MSSQNAIPFVELKDYRSLVKPKKTMHIAVSGGVLVSQAELNIIDTAAFQRLRGLRQLGLAYLVYPTALHTRFDHSLGTLAMVDRMVAAIRGNAHNSVAEREIVDMQEALARVYALVHDVTHIPFGHTLEDELGLLVRHDLNHDRIMHFIGPDSEIGEVIARDYGEDFLSILLNIYKWNGSPETREFGKELVFIHDLVSNTVCADLLDYIERDDYFCNLGVSFPYRFVNFLYLRTDEHGQQRVFVRLWKNDARKGRPRRDSLTDLCRLLEVRYLLAERVYFHHAKVAAGAMLGRAVQEAQEAELDETVWGETAYRDMSDDGLLERLRQCKSQIAVTLAGEVSRRRLYKTHYTIKWADLQAVQSGDHESRYEEVLKTKVRDPRSRKALEDRIAAWIRARPGDVLVYAPTRKMNRKEAAMNILWEGGPKRLKDIEDPVVAPRLRATLEAHGLLWGMRLLVRPTLSQEQRDAARQLLDIELLYSPEDGKKALEQFADREVLKTITHMRSKAELGSGAVFEKKYRRIVQKALALHHKPGGELWAGIEAAVLDEFPEPRSSVAE